MEVIALPLALFALAFIIHGFPDIRIGTRDTFNHYYGDVPEDEEDDE